MGKDIKITESFLGLDQNVRECQNVEFLQTCTTRKYMEASLKNCGCLNVVIGLIAKQGPYCTEEQLKCVEKINLDEDICLPPCSGLIVTSFLKSEVNKKLTSLNQNDVSAYD